MKHLLASALGLGAALLLTGCDYDGAWPDRVEGTGPSVAETRAVPAFDALDLSADAEVHFTQGSPAILRVEGQRNVLDVLRTDVRDNRLRVDFNHVTVRDYAPVHVYVTLPTLRSVTVSGAGTVRGEGAWDVPSFEVDLSGAGRAHWPQLTTQDLATHVSGAGTVQLGGAARRHRVRLSGAGQVDGFALNQATADVEMSGAGRARLTVTQELQATISGSGEVFYRGQPAVTARVSGSGRVVNDN